MKKLICLFLLLTLPCFANDVIDQARDLAYKQHKVDDALKLLDDYEKSHPDDVDVHTAIQNILLRHNRKAEAISKYKERYDHHPSALNGYLYLNLLDSPSEREKGFREIIKKYPAEVWGYAGIGTAFLDQDNLLQGAGEAKTGLEKVKNPARIHYVLARIYRRMEDYPEAAEHMREYYKLDPTADNREIAIAYDHLEVTHETDAKRKFELAQQFFKRYQEDMLKKDSGDSVTIAETLFVYADHNSSAAPFEQMLKAALRANDQEKPGTQDEQELHTRIRGALLSLSAWQDAKMHRATAAEKALGEAKKLESSEMYYYSALAGKLLMKKEDSLKDAIRAATYPPPYAQAKKLAEDLWNAQHGSSDGFETALHRQREEFAPQRKQRVLSQMISEKEPEFEMSTPNEKKLHAKDLSGKIVLMNFWAVWCPPCREELPHWNAFYAAHKNDPDLFFAAVGDEPWETMRNYMKNKNYDFPVFRNEKYWDEFKVDGIPTMVIIDPSGSIRFRNIGFEEGMEYDETINWQIAAVREAKENRQGAKNAKRD